MADGTRIDTDFDGWQTGRGSTRISTDGRLAADAHEDCASSRNYRYDQLALETDLFLEDASHFPGGHAAGVVFPRDVDEVIEALASCEAALPIGRDLLEAFARRYLAG